jgi:type III restriction enzyme
MGMKNILAINDEAHHCYREKPTAEEDEGDLKSPRFFESIESRG